MRKYIITMFLSFIILNNDVKANELIEVKLSKCVDGDTAWFIYENKESKFRFLAINTPESTNKIEEYGKEASSFTCNKLENAKKIEVEFDPDSDKQDKYDRYLAWIFVDSELLQEKLISKGLAEIEYIYGDYKYLSKLEKAETKAQKQKIGIWKETKTENNYLYIILSIIVILILYISNKKYRRKFNKKIKNKIKKKIRNSY